MTNVIKWLSDRHYEQKLVREQILKARAVSREILFNNERNPRGEDRLVLNISYIAKRFPESFK